ALGVCNGVEVYWTFRNSPAAGLIFTFEWHIQSLVPATGRKQKPEASPDDPTGNILRENTHLMKLEELPLFSFENLAKATDNFHAANKLGQGNACSFGASGGIEQNTIHLMLIFPKKTSRWTRNSCEKAFKILWTRVTGVYE
ncbi:unnamed protein product, partial [Ilex paraguariensis]